MSIHITYFVHGTTTDNEKDVATGWHDGELSELGKKQSIELGSQVKDKKFDVVFCSDLKRAIDSAQLAFGSLYTIITDKRLREANYGIYTGNISSSFKNNLPEYISKPFPDGESYHDIEKRIGDFIYFLKENYDGKHIAIVAHQAPQLAIEVLLNKKSWEQAIEEDWRNTKSWKPGWEYVVE